MTQQSDQEDEDERDLRSKKRRAWIWVSALIAAAIAIGAIVWTTTRPTEFPLAKLEAPAPPAPPRPAPLRSGDLDALKGGGVLVIAVPYQDFPFLPGHIKPLYDPVDRAEGLAEVLGLELRIQREGDPAAALRAVIERRADLAAVPTAIPREGDPSFGEFETTAPLFEVADVLVTRADGPSSLKALRDLRVVLPYGREIPSKLAALAEREQSVTVTLTEPGATVAELIDGVADGEIEATVVRRDFAASMLSKRAELRATLEVSEKRAYAWPVRRGAPELAKRASDYLRRASLLDAESAPVPRSWSEIKEAGVLRIATVNGPSFFVYNGRLVGFDYALARRFALSHDLRIAVELAANSIEAERMVAAGRADLVAIAVPVGETSVDGLARTAPVAQASWGVVRAKRAGVPAPGARVARVPARDAAWAPLLESARQKGYALESAAALDGSRELLASLLVGDVGLAVVQTSGPLAPPLEEDSYEIVETLVADAPLAWRVREDAELEGELAAYLDAYRASGGLATLESAYASTSTHHAARTTSAVAETGELSPFDHLFREYGDLRNLDWRLLASQAYQESRFDPQAKSWAGAVGLMQLMPRTARWLGVDGALTDPEESVEGGTKYLRWLYDHLEDDLAPPERLRFAIAAYNAGQGHLADGRALATELGLDPNRWYGHVDVAIANLSKKRFARKARYGYCRCEEAVEYVRLIEERYVGYVEALSNYERNGRDNEPVAIAP